MVASMLSVYLAGGIACADALAGIGAKGLQPFTFKGVIC